MQLAAFLLQTGPDGATIWAAATSGGGAIAVHLLACILAQAWSASEAISIWVELVEERKLEIAEAFDRDSTSDYSTLAATRSEITRAQLADWDASAWAWVRVADNVKKPEISSLRLLLNDLKLDVTKGQQLCKFFVEVWRSAMMIIESLLHGQPQMVFDATALLGITA